MCSWFALDWPAPSNVKALFTTRHGGMSSNPYASLNLGSHVGDDPIFVRKNRAKLREVLPSEPRWLKQVHGSTPVWVDNNEIRLEGDAALSRTNNVVCAILTADCLPIFLCNDSGTVAGILHAGWRSLNAGIIERTVIEMNERNVRIIAYLERLATVGVTEIYSNYECTFSNPERYFSYRRDGNTGRMAGLIWLTK